ncbi:MAG: bifunctional diaminohydroxyphosphoribosylaminopyrimidine deaminase/5-amino-6-(5-phosphoribosylamino)uracil reductase RibD [Ignavibacteria bacterium]|nr:bifunctional diaminohydroxyphosphoribosylaminopyrimidine deaminase/5-amino-6-(5-phosphoribosylamino)uracil reductase RibD [Ignavibacteria bacterium]
MRNPDERFMAECLKIAKKGAGYVSPNPLVGCLIVKDGKVIGKGFHRAFGESHAEVNAVEDAKRNGFDLEGATVYVNLEPCSHRGNTGPCAVLLKNEMPDKVVIGMQDPYEKVNGKGIKILKQAGIKVVEGVLQKECREFNKFFINFVTKKRPFVTLKIAQSIDGKIALNNKDSKYITSESSRKIVHKMRSEFDAVLIGTNTAMLDNPKLDARLTKGRTPFRIVLDKDLKLPEHLEIFNDENADRTIIISSVKAIAGKRNISVRKIPVKQTHGRFSISDILNSLYEENISSIMVEGGMNLFSQFLNTGLYDDVFFFIAPKIIGSGISAFDDASIKSLSSAHELCLIDQKTIDNELILHYENVHRHS